MLPPQTPKISKSFNLWHLHTRILGMSLGILDEYILENITCQVYITYTNDHHLHKGKSYSHQ